MPTVSCRPGSAKDPDFTLNVIPKSVEISKMLIDALTRNVVFATINREKLEEVVSVMYQYSECTVNPNPSTVSGDLISYCIGAALVSVFALC